MKPILVREKNIFNTAVIVDWAEYDYFYNPLHYHPEYELTLIIKSFGQRQVGDNIENFGAGDLVLIGSELPHVWKSDDIFLTQKSGMKAQAVVVKFLREFAGPNFFNRPELSNIRKLLDEVSLFGLKLDGDLKLSVEKIMLSFPGMNDADRLINLLQILNIISQSNEYRLLASNTYRNEKVENIHRINIVLDYLMEHYQEHLSLETIASRISMNKNAFCRFFKKGTHRNLFSVINEVRVSKACQHLIETDMNVLQICFACGFNNISNFNKVFKKISGTSPLLYRQSFRKKMKYSPSV